jgi:hypothetical protein
MKALLLHVVENSGVSAGTGFKSVGHWFDPNTPYQFKQALRAAAEQRV